MVLQWGLVANSKFIAVLAVVVVITSIFSIGLVYMSAKSLFSTISGYATSTGVANLTVEATVIINFTTNYASWGSGRVNSGYSSAYLTTMCGGNNATNGNWSLTSPCG